jgi:hypothetical protein
VGISDDLLWIDNPVKLRSTHESTLHGGATLEHGLSPLIIIRL